MDNEDENAHPQHSLFDGSWKNVVAFDFKALQAARRKAVNVWDLGNADEVVEKRRRGREEEEEDGIPLLKEGS